MHLQLRRESRLTSLPFALFPLCPKALKGPESAAWVSTTGQKVTEIYANFMENHWKIMDEMDEITGYYRDIFWDSP